MKNLLSFILCLCIHYGTIAQSKIELLSSDILEGIKDSSGVFKQKISRGVFQHDNAILNADVSYFFADKNTFDSYGNVHISQGDSLNIFADILHYDGNKKLALLEKNIILVHNNITLTTHHLTYNLNTKLASYVNGGKLVHKDNILTSEIGDYFVNKNEAYFKKKAIVVSPDAIIKSDTLKYNTQSKKLFLYGFSKILGKEDWLSTYQGEYNTISQQARFWSNNKYWQKGKTLIGDTLFYDRIKGIGWAKNNVEFRDSLNNTCLKGNLATYRSQNAQVIVTQKPYAVLVLEKKSLKNDSLWFSADTLHSYEIQLQNDTSFRVINAYRKTRIFKNDLQSIADSLSFSYRDSVLKMFYRPIMWAEGSQMTADTIHITLKHQQLDKLYLIQNSFLTSLSADSISFDQVGGRKIDGLFKKNKLKKLKVGGNAESIYTAYEQLHAIGINRSVSSEIGLEFQNNKLKEVTFIRNPEMKFIPNSKLLPEEKYLKNFTWKPKSRPLSKWHIINHPAMETDSAIVQPISNKTKK